MSYSRWNGSEDSLYIWRGFDGLHIWKPGQDDSNGLLFKDGANLEFAKAAFRALNDHLRSNGIETKIRAGKLTMKKTK